MTAFTLHGIAIGLTLMTAVNMAETTFLEAGCKLAFPEAMLHLQDAITKHGYTISRVQHVDKGLTAKGYKTKNYKVVFFGKKTEIESIKSNFPQLIPFIPLSITLIEKNKINTITGLRPKMLEELFNSNLSKRYFVQWEKDFQLIFKSFQNCNNT